jgi:hypothetical protein
MQGPTGGGRGGTESSADLTPMPSLIVRVDSRIDLLQGARSETDPGLGGRCHGRLVAHGPFPQTSTLGPRSRFRFTSADA